MTTLVMEIYEALKKAGIDDELPKAAAKVIGVEEKSQLATKADLAGLGADLQGMLNKHLQIIIGLMIALTGIFAAIVKL